MIMMRKPSPKNEMRKRENGLKAEEIDDRMRMNTKKIRVKLTGESKFSRY
jgi:hypothetical protein